MKYIYAWKNNPKRQSMYKKRCRILARGKMNSALVEFENGQKEIVSRNALRREFVEINAIDPSFQEYDDRHRILK